MFNEANSEQLIDSVFLFSSNISLQWMLCLILRFQHDVKFFFCIKMSERGHKIKTRMSTESMKNKKLVSWQRCWLNRRHHSDPRMTKSHQLAPKYHHDAKWADCIEFWDSDGHSRPGYLKFKSILHRVGVKSNA